jgi:hypothetical protein
MAGNYRFYNQDEQDVLPYKDNYVETGAESQPLYDESQSAPAEQPQDNFKGYNPKMRDVTNYYQNPVEDYVKPMPDNMTYPAHSLIPKDKLKDPSRPIPYDINPADWKTGDDATDAERNQRKMVRNYTQQLYEEMAKGGDIEQARKEAARRTNLADVGQGLEQMFKSRSVAHGGPGVDTAYWDAQRKGAQLGAQEAEQDRSKKIADYITKKKLGSEAVSEHQQLKDMDIKNKMNDPESDISMAYQDAIKEIYPDMFSPKVDPITGDEYDPLNGMSANDLMAASKMLEGKARIDINQQLGLGRLNLDKQLGEARLAQPRGGAKSPEQTKAEIDRIKAQTGVYGAQKAKLEREPVVKPAAAAARPAGGNVSEKDFISDKRFIATALKEKKALAEYEKSSQDALKSFREGGNYSFREGYIPSIEVGGKNITGGKRSEHNAYLAKIATQIINKVPGIRSDSDFQNLVKPMLPSPGDPKDVVEKKYQIFKNFLDSSKPDSTTYDMLPDEDKAKLEGKNMPSPLPTQEEYKTEEATMLPPPKGQLEVTQDGIDYRWNGREYVEKSKGGK